MDLKQIKELILAMEESGITKITLKEKTGFELALERQDTASLAEMSSVVHHHHPSMHHHSPYAISKNHDFPHIQQVPHVGEEKKLQGESKVEGKFITSPMVGTFYSASSPENPPFIKVGDVVQENTVVCIIEAMKVMNEVKACVSGVVAEVCAENGHPLEFGTKLFRIV